MGVSEIRGTLLGSLTRRASYYLGSIYEGSPTIVNPHVLVASMVFVDPNLTAGPNKARPLLLSVWGSRCGHGGKQQMGRRGRGRGGGDIAMRRVGGRYRAYRCKSVVRPSLHAR